MTSISGKSALITGGTRGIGLAIARALLEGGANVFLTARDAKQISDVVQDLQKRTSPASGSRVEGKACDVRLYDEVRQMVAEADRALGGLDILINNAGVGVFGEVERMTPDEWRAVIETNLSGVFYCCREVIPLLKRRGGGYVVNIGSLAGKNAFAGGGAYNASKFGLIGFSEALMQEVRHDHIRVSYVMPGSVNTGFGRSGEEDPALTWKLAPEDVAIAVINLLEMDPRALASRVELRPSEPRK